MTKGLIDVSAIMGGNLVKVEKIENTMKGFPQLKMHHQVQADKDDPNFMHLYGVSENPLKLEKDYKLTVIAAVDAVRDLREKEDGGGNYYHKVYGDLNSKEAKAILDAKDSDYAKKKDTGRVYLMMITAGDTTTMCEFDCFGIYNDYWSFLEKAQIGEQKKVTVNLDNHKVNLQKSKSGQFYHSPKKFKQYEIAPLEPNELEIIQDLVNNNITDINDWIKREDNVLNKD